MTSIWHDYSRLDELEPIARVVGAVTTAAGSMGIACLIAGAFARDLLLQHRWGIPTGRRTDDLDFALAVDDWQQFEQLRNSLIQGRCFEPAGAPQRLRYKDGHLIDIVPFGAIETSERSLQWPPQGDPVMDAFGFREALACAHSVMLPGAVRADLVSLPALAMLKLVCWNDRHQRMPGKDAHDLALILGNYLDAGNVDRLWGEFSHWLQESDFDYERAGARMLGHDIRRLLDEVGAARLDAIVLEQCSDTNPGVLPAEMNRNDPDRARALLKALRQGLCEEPR